MLLQMLIHSSSHFLEEDLEEVTEVGEEREVGDVEDGVGDVKNIKHLYIKT
jgi:hypothetical protein